MNTISASRTISNLRQMVIPQIRDHKPAAATAATAPVGPRASQESCEVAEGRGGHDEHVTCHEVSQVNGQGVGSEDLYVHCVAVHMYSTWGRV